MDGVVAEASTKGNFGQHLRVINNDIEIIYAHCSELLVTKGDMLKQGQIIAKVGATGKATGPHLHFQISRDERPVNPELVVQF